MTINYTDTPANPRDYLPAPTDQPNLNPSGLPRLNVPLLRELIAWAMRDETAFARFDWFARWDQGTWGSIEGVEEWTDDRYEWFAARTVPGQTAFARDKNVCGTAYCQAGGAVVASDYRLIFIDDGDAERCIKIEPTGHDNEQGRPTYRDVGEMQDIADTARGLLGLTYEEADVYFEGSNEIADLMRYANRFADARGLDLLYGEDEIADWL